jgi:hypothetical protein
MVRVVFLLGVIAFCFSAEAQFTYTLDNSIPVVDNNEVALQSPWAGGLNAAQYNTMDLNADGVDDLVLFDRMANKVITFLAQNNTYVAAPEYEAFFPAELSNWLLLRDYNCDGKKDLFTGDILGIKVYINTTASTNQLEWKQYLFSTGSGTKSTVLLTTGFSGKINLKLEFDDLPAIIDADGDGDLDIFNARFAGAGTIEYHKNVSNERYARCDSLEYKRVTQSWGQVRECSCGVFAFNGADCPATGGRVKHAGGKSLLVLDVNGDGKLDVLFSEAECTQLYLLQNKGTIDSPKINTSLIYPVSKPANFLNFPTAFFEDLDFDGKKDLVVAPNIFNKEFLTTNLKQSNWIYKNNGTNTAPNFTFVKNDFLQDAMIDVGDNAVPAFVDFDGDGDQDLLISQNSSQTFSSRVSIYENTGSSSLPAFKFGTDDFFNFSFSNFYNLKISIADIDHNNTEDLVFTATDFNTGFTEIYYIPNKSLTRLDINGQSVQAVDFTMTGSENIALTDVDNDGWIDLLVGRNDGSLEFWRNNAINGTPSFSLAQDNFLGIASSVTRQNLAVFAADLDNDDRDDLVLGDQNGVLNIISDYKNNNIEEQSEVVFNPLLNSYAEQNLGGRIWPVVVNLYGTDKPSIVVGNILGGLKLLKHDNSSSLSDKPQVDVYPNPIFKDEILKIQSNLAAAVQIYTITGKQVASTFEIQPNSLQEYTVSRLATGMYIVKVTANGKSTSRRFIVR